MKPPELFIKRLRESQNQREAEDEDFDQPTDDNYVDSTGQKQGSYQAQIKENDYEVAVKNKEIDLLGLDEEEKPVSTSKPSTSDDLLGGGMIGGGSGSVNIKIPFAECLNSNTPSFEKKITGLQIEAVFQREGENAFLELKLTNKMQKVLGVIFSNFNNFNRNSQLSSMLTHSRLHLRIKIFQFNK